ncbi:MAG: rod shape-determining protein [Thermovirga sp.]|nr:rod shape-determining protein [Thermovirga sp.]
MWGMDIGIDLGTANVLVFMKNNGVVLREPSVVAVDLNTDRILAVGDEAKNMLGRTPGNVVAIRPLKDGVIADYTMTEAMLRHFLKKVITGFGRLMRRRGMICVPSGATDVERRAVLEAAVEIGTKEAFLIEEPMAAAIGANLDISEPRGNLIVDIGGGTTDVAVLSYGGIVVSESLRLGGDRLDENITRFIRKEYNLAIGEQTAEAIKINAANCDPSPRKEQAMVIKGRDLVHGLPRQVEITDRIVAKAIEETVNMIIEGIRQVLEKTPPELSADIIDRGITLSGGGALLKGLPELIMKKTQIPAYVADLPLECVAIGTGKALDNLDRLRSSGSLIGASRRRERKVW